MTERLGRPTAARSTTARAIAGAVACVLLAGAGSIETTTDATQSPDNQKSTKGTTGAISSFTPTKVKKKEKKLGLLMYGVSSDAEQAELALRYLRQNELQLRQDLALGAGPALDDLAWIAEIHPDNEREFARVLQQHREELLSAADARQLTRERAASCFVRIGELIARHPLLDRDRQAWLARHSSPAG